MVASLEAAENEELSGGGCQIDGIHNGKEGPGVEETGGVGV